MTDNINNHMKRILIVLAVLTCILDVRAQNRFDGLYAGLPLDLSSPELPAIPDTRVNLADCGVKGDGVTLCTDAFRTAIAELSAAGGGHLDVPAGVWLTGPIVLASHIDLHLEAGALVIFTPDKHAYVDGELKNRVNPCFFAQKCTDISITGKGILDGNGKYWRYAKRDKLSDPEWKDLLKLGGSVSEDGKLWFPTELKGYRNLTDSPEKEESIRQNMIVLRGCTRVLISGVTVQNSPKFHITPNRCADIAIEGVTVRCPWNAQNGDGIDIAHCQRVLITGCTVDVGDDGICMKGGSGEKGLKDGVCSDILICDNVVFHAHGGFVIGSDVSGGMERIVVKDCTFSGTDTGLRFKSAMGRGGHCEDIFISDIRMNDIREAAVTFNCDYANVTYVNLSAGDDTSAFAPDFGGISISGVVCRECPVAVYAHGIDGLECIHDVNISSSTFLYLKKATDIDSSTASLSFTDVEFVPARF